MTNRMLPWVVLYYPQGAVWTLKTEGNFAFDTKDGLFKDCNVE